MMPYISTEKVKAVREELKARFPKYRFAVRLSGGHLGIIINILSGPLAEADGFCRQINEYHYERHYEEQPRIVALLSNLLDAIQTAAPCKTEHEDADYGSIPTYYLNLEFGRAGKAFQTTPEGGAA